MSSIKLSPASTGSAIFTIEAPATSTNRTLTLPDQTGTVLTNAGPFTANASASAGAVTIDASNNVGIGTSSPAYKVDVNGAINANTSINVSKAGSDSIGSGPYFYLTNVASGSSVRAWAAQLGASGSYDLWGFDGSNWNMRTRIDSSGNFIVGSSSLPSSSNKARAITPNYLWSSAGSQTTSYIHFYFTNGNGDVGTISTSGSSTTYATSSDYRLKESVQPMAGALSKVQALKPVTYKWKTDGSDGEGFIAHELAEVFPQAVIGEKDAVDAEGNPVYQGIDTSFLVATLTAAIQELNAKVAALEARLASDGPSNGGQA